MTDQNEKPALIMQVLWYKITVKKSTYRLYSKKLAITSRTKIPADAPAIMPMLLAFGSDVVGSSGNTVVLSSVEIAFGIVIMLASVKVVTGVVVGLSPVKAVLAIVSMGFEHVPFTGTSANFVPHSLYMA